MGAAQASGAQNIPEASLHLKMATDAVALAEAEMDRGEHKAATLTLQRAKADADLAKSLAIWGQSTKNYSRRTPTWTTSTAATRA